MPTKRNISCWKLDREIKKSLMKLIEDRRKRNSVNIVQENGPKDLLGLMMQASISSPNITVHDIIEECKSFFFAGKQTTSNLLTWTTVLLAMHPQWQVQAREEVLRVCGSRDIPTRDDVVKLKTVKAQTTPSPSQIKDKNHVLSLTCFPQITIKLYPLSDPFCLFFFFNMFT